MMMVHFRGQSLPMVINHTHPASIVAIFCSRLSVSYLDIVKKEMLHQKVPFYHGVCHSVYPSRARQ